MQSGVAIRPALPDEHQALARLWHAGWHDAHAAFVPAELTRLRTFESFLDRIAGFEDRLRVAGPAGAPLGLCVIQDDEIYQIYASRAAHGTGIAAALLGDGEARLRQSGVTRARLECVIENARAIRFYEKHGWERVGQAAGMLETEKGPFAMPVLVFTKSLA
jgi:ribosomal protein S18 acetylase RimI-like enzyme